MSLRHIEYRLATAVAATALVVTCTSGAAVPSAAAPTAGTYRTDAAAAAASQVLTAVNTFLGTLSSSQKTTVQATRTQANLSKWSNLPDALYTRAGLRMDALTSAQQTAVLNILGSALSPAGFEQVTGITYGDGVLKAQGGIDLDFGADHYWIRILGTPSATGKWTVQYGGHHLAVNITLSGDTMTLGPTLWGAQPAYYTKSGATVEPLVGETDKAYTVLQSLNSTQLAAAILDTPVKEIVLGAGQDGKTLAYDGVRASTFTAAQKTLLLDLVNEWITPLNTEQAAAKLAEAQAVLDQTYFAWSGSTAANQPVYYRVQSPAFTIEFAHQQGSGANAGGITHIHSIYRENGNDYGAED
ncbi:DUF3500 domain-containing protein [Streptomyces asoensis]|uniref:DUF3500 domain-containing protein n=1 Tax=Streptomyces asoensis TaxID=249586 RepID=A0A6M4X5W6_9ACTN|nr:DUF3500 domain-containing protein [Streptomyces asoensis]QJT05586.1 DUF3500 domain-containing protein [Streptomyces asoensis]